MRVPTVREGSVQVAGVPDAWQRIQTSPAEFGGLAADGLTQAGEAVQGLGGLLADHARKMAEDDARTEAMDAYNGWARTQGDLLYSSETGYFTLSGEAAYRGAEGITSTLKGAWDSLAKTLSPQARRMIEPRVMQDMQAVSRDVARHAASGREAWQDGSTQATAQGMAAEAARHFADPDRRDAALALGRSAIFERAAQRRWSIGDPRLKSQIDAFDSAALSGVLRQQAETDTAGAKTYFDTVRNRLSVDDARAMGALLDQRVMLQTVETTVRDLQARPWAGSGELSRQEVWDRQRTEAETITDPTVRRAVQARLERDYRSAEARDAANRKSGREEVYAQVMQGVDPASLPPEVQQTVGADFVGQMQGLYAGNGKAPYDPSIEATLQQAALDSETFAEMDLTVLLGRHDNGRLDYWMEQQRAMTSSDAGAVVRQSLLQPVHAMGLSIVQEQFPVAVGADLRALERQTRAAAQTRLWIDSVMEEKGQPPTEEDLYRFISSPRSRGASDKTGGLGSGGFGGVGWRGINSEKIREILAATPGNGVIQVKAEQPAKNEDDVVEQWRKATPEERPWLYANMGPKERERVHEYMTPEERESEIVADMYGNKHRPPNSKIDLFRDYKQIENWKEYYKEVESRSEFSKSRKIVLMTLYAYEGGNIPHHVSKTATLKDENGKIVSMKPTSSGITYQTLIDFKNDKNNKNNEINRVEKPEGLSIKQRVEVMNWYLDKAVRDPKARETLDGLGDTQLIAVVEDSLFRHGVGGAGIVMKEAIEDIAKEFNASLSESEKKDLEIKEMTPGIGPKTVDAMSKILKKPEYRDRFLNEIADARMDYLLEKAKFAAKQR